MSDQREKLIQILNSARCQSNRHVWNGELADMILAEFELVERPRMDCGCLEGAHNTQKGTEP